jgi:hypothetical protein
MRLLFIIIFAIALTSCNKELPDEFVPYNNSLQIDTSWKTTVTADAPVNQISKIFTDDIFSKDFTAENGGSFQLNDSLKLEIPASCLLKEGTAVTGTVSMKVIIYRKKGQFIAAGLSTLYSGQLLESAGILKVSFYKNTDTLAIAPGKFYTVRLKSSNSSPLTGCSIFYKDTANPALQTNWIPSSDNSLATTSSQGSSDPGYNLQLSKQYWINCAKALDAGGAEKIRVNVILPVSFTNANTMVFATFKNHLSVVRLKTDFASRSFYVEDIPAGKEMTIVSISKIGADYYLGNVNFIAAKNTFVKFPPEKKSNVQDIVSIILGL